MWWLTGEVVQVDNCFYASEECDILCWSKKRGQRLRTENLDSRNLWLCLFGQQSIWGTLDWSKAAEEIGGFSGVYKNGGDILSSPIFRWNMSRNATVRLAMLLFGHSKDTMPRIWLLSLNARKLQSARTTQLCKNNLAKFEKQPTKWSLTTQKVHYGAIFRQPFPEPNRNILHYPVHATF